MQCIADDLAIANHLAALGNVHQGDLVALRHKVHSDQAVRELGPGRYTLVIDDDHYVVPLMQADVTRRIGMFNQLH